MAMAMPRSIYRSPAPTLDPELLPGQIPVSYAPLREPPLAGASSSDKPIMKGSRSSPQLSPVLPVLGIEHSTPALLPSTMAAVTQSPAPAVVPSTSISANVNSQPPPAVCVDKNSGGSSSGDPHEVAVRTRRPTLAIVAQLFAAYGDLKVHARPVTTCCFQIHFKLTVLPFGTLTVLLGIMIGVSIGMLVRASRHGVALEAMSELEALDIMYNVKPAILHAAFGDHVTHTLRAGDPLSEAITSGFLRTECARLGVDFATLVMADDLRIVAGCNKDRAGETGFDPAGAVTIALRENKEMTVNVILDRKEVVEREGIARLAAAPESTHSFLFHLILQPAFASESDTRPVAVFVAGVAVLGADPTVQAFMPAPREGYAGMYLAVSGALVGSLLRIGSEQAAEGVSIAEALEGAGLLARAAASARREAVTASFALRGTTMTFAARAVLGVSGSPVGVQVKGVLPTNANQILRETLIPLVSVGFATLLLVAALVFAVARSIATPLAHLQRTIDSFFQEVEGNHKPGVSLSSRDNLLEELAAHKYGRDEVGALARAFGRMVTRVQQGYAAEVAAKQEVAREVLRSRSIMEAAGDGILLVNAESEIVLMNRKMEQMFGYPPEMVIGQNVTMLMQESVASVHNMLVKRHLQDTSGAAFNHLREVFGLRRNGEEFPIEIAVTKTNVGGDTFFVAMVRDITSRKQLEGELVRERERTEALLRNMLPGTIAERLKRMVQRDSESGHLGAGGTPASLSRRRVRSVRDMHDALATASAPATNIIADRVEGVSVMFAGAILAYIFYCTMFAWLAITCTPDVVGFTPLAASMDAKQLVALLNDLFSEFDALAEQYGLEKIKTLGDAFMCAGGVPPGDGEGDDAEADPHLVRMAAMALEMHTVVARKRIGDGKSPLRIRIGIHVGTVIAGVIGRKKLVYDLWGDPVNVASRMESSGTPGLTQVSAEVHDHLVDSFEFEDRGQVLIKGRGYMRTFFLLRARERLRSFSSPRAEATSTDAGLGLSWPSTRRRASLAGPQSSSLGLMASVQDGIDREHLRILDQRDFSVTSIPEAVYPGLVASMFARLGLIQSCNVPESLGVFVREALAAYRPSVPFHNQTHAVDVCHMAFVQLRALAGPGPALAAGAFPTLDSVEMLAVLVASLGHDLDHPGLTNKFLVQSGSPIAQRFAGSCPLERHHAACLDALLDRPDANIASGLSPADRARFRRLVTDLVLATNMDAHADYLAAFRARFGPRDREGSGSPPAPPPLQHLSDGALLASILVKCADLANAARAFSSSKQWAALLQEEHFAQGRLEAELGLAVSLGMAPSDSPAIQNSALQVSFLSGTVLPLFEAVAAVLPHVGGPFVACIVENVRRWRDVQETLGIYDGFCI